MNNPVLIIEEVLVIFQTVLKSSGLVESSSLGLVCGVHHCLHHSLVVRQVDCIVSHNLGFINTVSIIFMVTVYLDCKVLEARIKKSVEVSFDCFLDQVRIETSGHHSHTDEGRQDGTGLEDWFVWEGVDGDQTYEVADCLR